MKLMTDNTPATIEQLNATIETAFRAGDPLELAIGIWEAITRFPDKASVAKIYLKKLLREPSVTALTLDTLQRSAKKLREEEDATRCSRYSALGLLLFPKDRYLSLSLIDSAEKLEKFEWIEGAVRPLGKPAADDIVLLNLYASLAHNEGRYEESFECFSKILKLEPDNELALQNLSAAMVGLERVDDAIKLLEGALENTKDPKDYLHRLMPLYHQRGVNVGEKLEYLDERLFQACSTANLARAHADVRMFLQDFRGVKRGLSALYEINKNPGDAFSLSEVELALGEFDAGLERYAVRFPAFPDLDWGNRNAKPYTGQVLTTETLYVWGEQGIGDEVMFSFFFDELSRRVASVIVAMEPRLIPFYTPKYPTWTFVNRHDKAEVKIGDYADFACPSGDLMVYLLTDVLKDGIPLASPHLAPSEDRLKIISDLLPSSENPRVAISWRGGQDVNGKIRSLELEQLMAGIDADLNIEVISLQYDEGHEEEVKKHGDRRIALSGLNNKQDLDGIFSLMVNCDAVLTIDNAVAHFAAALGVPTYLLLPAGQTQYRWKNASFKNLFFPKVKLFIQDQPGLWEGAAKEAWSRLLEDVS